MAILTQMYGTKIVSGTKLEIGPPIAYGNCARKVLVNGNRWNFQFQDEKMVRDAVFGEPVSLGIFPVISEYTGKSNYFDCFNGQREMQSLLIGGI